MSQRTIPAYLRCMPSTPRLRAPKLRATSRLLALAALVPLAACNAVVLHPAGDVAVQQRDLILIATGLMLLVIVPVMVLTVIFAWRYRHTNEDAEYKPDWDHSTSLELVIWAVPLLIIICLGAVTWTGTHLLDPYRPIGRIDAARTGAPTAKPLEVQVVALDWKWLFIYPEYGIATINELAAPVDRPIRFRITASSVMNSFYIPALAGQIYAMPGMETKLNAVVNRPGDFAGFSANLSGDGFSDMRFRFHALDQRGFAGWIARTRAAGGTLDRARYVRLEQPTQAVPVMRFATVTPALFDAAVNRCVEPGKPCMADTMRADAMKDGAHGADGPMAMAVPEKSQAQTALQGAGLALPGAAAPRVESAADRSVRSSSL